ncbi:MAG: hypothetical protein B6230_07345 [Desulfobacteraceae bacterium 4572_89]|nr:MAG: hypothetical protein B6230_07345 [Desulfobacteraceae bacterium 4572_89]
MYSKDPESVSLGKIKELFHHFSMGFHLCIDDGELYRELTENEVQYRSLFNSLGYNLSQGTQGVYYFEPDKERTSVNRLSKKFTLFMAILYDFLADQGKDPISAITEEYFQVKDLPHLKQDQYRKILEKVNITRESDLLKLVQRLQKYGFLEFRDNYLILFKKSVSRFTTLFAEFKEPLKTHTFEAGENNGD